MLPAKRVAHLASGASMLDRCREHTAQARAVISIANPWDYFCMITRPLEVLGGIAWGRSDSRDVLHLAIVATDPASRIGADAASDDN
jgi:hypothetical protein